MQLVAAPHSCSLAVSAAGRRRQRHNVVQATMAVEKSTVGAAAKKKLGDSDLMVSECCLGTMTWGCQNDEAEAHEQLSYALEACGINMIDTAEIYPVPPKAETQGSTDRFIGSWLKDRRRGDYVLASKVSGFGRQNYLRDSGANPRVDAANIEESVNKSLARLGTDYLDLLQIHWPDRYVPLFGAEPYNLANEREGDIPFEEQMRALERVIQAGKVRYVGVSNETSLGVMRFSQLAEQAGLPKIVSIQNSYSLLVRGGFETDLAEVCAPRNCNVGLLAYSPLAGGALSGKYVQPTDPKALEKARFNLFQGYMARYTKSLAREAVAEYCKVAEKHGLTPTELSLAYVKSRWFVTSTIIGATTMQQLRENIAAFDVDLSEECVADLEAVHRRYRDPAFN